MVLFNICYLNLGFDSGMCIIYFILIWIMVGVGFFLL